MNSGEQREGGGRVIGVLATLLVWGVSAYVAGFALVLLVGASAADYHAQALATFAGIVAGLPVALRITQWQERRAEASRARDRLVRIAELTKTLKEDLTAIRDDLNIRLQQRHGFIAPFLGSSVWDTIKSSGDTELFDPNGLRTIARAYDQIALTGYLERVLFERVFDSSRGTGIYDASPDSLDRKIMEAIKDEDPHTVAAVSAALSVCQEYLGRVNVPFRSD